MISEAIKLEDKLKFTTAPRERVDILNKLSIEYMVVDLKRAADCNNQAMELARNSRYRDGIAFARYAHGMYLFKSGNSGCAIKHMSDTLKSLKDPQDGIAARLHNGLGLIHYSLGDYDVAMDHYMKSLAIAEKNELTATIAGCYHNIGMIYRRKGDIDSALEYANRNLAVMDEDVQSTRRTKTLNEMGLIKLEMEQYDDALELFQQIHKIAQEDSTPVLEAMALTNIALTYQHKHELEQSQHFSEDAIALYEKLGDKRGMVTAYLNMAALLGNQDHHNRAIAELKKGLEIALSIDTKPLIYKIHQMMSEAFEILGLHLLALRHYKLFHEIKEQVFNEASEERIRTITADHELDKAKRDSELHRVKNIELARAQKSAHLGNWEWDRERNVMHGSDEFYNILGYLKPQKSIRGEQFLKRVHAKDAILLEASLDSILKSGKPFEMTIRILNAKGAESIVSVQAERDSQVGEGSFSRIIGTVQDITERNLAELERETLITDLQEALSRIKVLSGLVPICANCKKIRDDQGFWNHIEEYIMKHSDAVFSHGICADCAHELYPELYKEDR